MAERKVLQQDAKRPSDWNPKPDSAAAWRWVGWFGGVLLVVGVGDFALAWYPVNFGSPEWEFGTIAASYSGLPLVTMGFAAVLGSAVARGAKVLTGVTGAVLIVSAVALAGGFVLFLTDVPVALRASPDQLDLGIKKAVAKTALLGVVFTGAYMWAGVAALRHASRLSKRGVPS